jgi:hypothetical protein
MSSSSDIEKDAGSLKGGTALTTAATPGAKYEGQIDEGIAANEDLHRGLKARQISMIALCVDVLLPSSSPSSPSLLLSPKSTRADLFLFLSLFSLAAAAPSALVSLLARVAVSFEEDLSVFFSPTCPSLFPSPLFPFLPSTAPLADLPFFPQHHGRRLLCRHALSR